MRRSFWQRPASVWLFQLLAALAYSEALAAEKPNVLFILADDLGYSDLGCYGGEIETPHLNSLAKDGLRFTQFYNTARCWPSRAAVLTGYYPQQVRRDAHYRDPRNGGKGIRPEWAPLLPALLKPLGYRSYHSGKWHIDRSALAGGFDHSYTLDDHNRNFYPQQHTLDEERLPAVERGSDYFTSTHIADHAIQCLVEHAKEHAAAPFFHYLCFTSPHFPLQAPQEDIDRYLKRYSAGWNVLQAERGQRLKSLGITRNDPPTMETQLGPPYDFPQDLEKLGPGEIFRPKPWDELTSEQQAFQATKMAIHAAMVHRMDAEIGRVIAQLEQMGALENTIIFFASDNGASAEIMVRGDGHDPQAPPGSGATFLCLGPGFSSAANTPFRRHKTWVHEGGISTPLIVHWPRGIAARGELRYTPSHLIDIVPTVLELAGGELPKTWAERPVPPSPGRSLAPIFTADKSDLHEDLWWCHDDHRAVRVGDWKLVAAKGDPWELYDLSRDRGESQDLAAQYPDKARELEARWTRRAEEFQKLAEKDVPAPEQNKNKDKNKKKKQKQQD